MEGYIKLDNECVFRNILDTCNTIKKHEKRVFYNTKSTIQRCSQEREDGYHCRIYSDFDEQIYCTDCYTMHAHQEKRFKREKEKTLINYKRSRKF